MRPYYPIMKLSCCVADCIGRPLRTCSYSGVGTIEFNVLLLGFRASRRPNSQTYSRYQHEPQPWHCVTREIISPAAFPDLCNSSRNYAVSVKYTCRTTVGLSQFLSISFGIRCFSVGVRLDLLGYDNYWITMRNIWGLTVWYCSLDTYTLFKRPTLYDTHIWQ